MDIKDFIKDFANQFEDTDINEFAAGTNYHELEEWSSLIRLSVISMIDKKYNVLLTGTEIRSANTIQDLYDLVVSKKQ